MALVSQIWLHLLLPLRSSALPGSMSPHGSEEWLQQQQRFPSGGCEEGVCEPRGLAPGGPSLEAVGARRGLHGRGLRQRHVVEVGQADVVPEALPHVHPVVQGVEFLGNVAPD